MLSESQVLVEDRIVGGVGEVAARLRGAWVVPGDQNVPTRGEQADDSAQERALAGTGAAAQEEQFTCLNGEVDGFDDGRAGQRHAQGVHFECGRVVCGVGHVDLRLTGSQNGAGRGIGEVLPYSVHYGVSRKAVATVIAGASTREQVRANAAAAAWFPPEELLAQL